MNAPLPAVAGRPIRDCSACAHAASAMPGAPLVCVFQRAYQPTDAVRAPRGACGPHARMWRPITQHGKDPA